MVEGARLEIVWAGNRLEGSNPFASATHKCAQKSKIRSSFYSDRIFFCHVSCETHQKAELESRASRSVRILSFATRKRAFFVALFFWGESDIMKVLWEKRKTLIKLKTKRVV